MLDYSSAVFEKLDLDIAVAEIQRVLSVFHSTLRFELFGIFFKADLAFLRRDDLDGILAAHRSSLRACDLAVERIVLFTADRAFHILFHGTIVEIILPDIECNEVFSDRIRAAEYLERFSGLQRSDYAGSGVEYAYCSACRLFAGRILFFSEEAFETRSVFTRQDVIPDEASVPPYIHGFFR